MGKTQDDLDKATTEIEEATTVMDGAGKLIDAIVAAARENAGNPAKLNAAMDAFVAEKAELKAAVAANTVAASEVPPEAPA